MKYEMSEYYTVLHFLRDFFVDREYPLSFVEFKGSFDCEGVEMSTEYISTHNKSYKLTGISEGDEITFLIPNRKYDTCDKFEINICSNETYNTTDIDVLFSESVTGQPLKKMISSASKVCEPDKINNIEYLLKDTAKTLDKKSKFMSIISSITLKFNKSFETVYLSDMLFRTIEYQRTLEDIDYHIQDAKNHILERILLTEIPLELEHLIPKAAAAYSWLMWWENEGRVMSDGTNLARNYYDRLMNDDNGVNAAIDRWLAKQKEVEPDDINMDLVGSVRLFRNECVSRHSRRFSKGTFKPRNLQK